MTTPASVNPAAGDYRLRPGSEAIRMKVGLTTPPVGMREIVATSVND